MRELLEIAAQLRFLPVRNLKRPSKLIGFSRRPWLNAVDRSSSYPVHHGNLAISFLIH
jgi:hypothetical protein